MTKQLDPLSVLAMLARMHGTTLAEEVDKYNADLAQRIASGYAHPIVSEEERVARTKAVKRRALDKVKANRAALKALKPKPSAEEIAAKAVAKAERKKASRRRYRVKGRDALRVLRAKSGWRLHGGGPVKGVPVGKRCVVTADERRARKSAVDKRYVLATQEALHALRKSAECSVSHGSQKARTRKKTLETTPRLDECLSR